MERSLESGRGLALHASDHPFHELWFALQRWS